MKEKEVLKHLEYINNELVLKSQTSLSEFELVKTIPTNIYDKYFDRDDNLIELTLNDKRKLLISYYQVKASGDINNKNKRIQIPANKHFHENTLLLAVYPSGNKNCYILFSSGKALSNKNNTSKSIWIHFYNIYYCLNCNKDIYDIAIDKVNNEEYKIFFSTDLNNLLNLNESKFWTLDNFHIKHITNIFETSIKLNKLKEDKNISFDNSPIINNTISNDTLNSLIKNIEMSDKIESIDDLKNDFAINNQNEIEEQNFKEEFPQIDKKMESDLLGMDTFLYNEKNNKDNGVSDYLNPVRLSSNREIGRLAEEKFYEFIKSNILTNINFIKENLGIFSIESIEWANEKKEEFRPFDFVINNNIYIDVKGTKESSPYFEITDTEYNFRKETVEKGNRYFVVSLFKLSLSEQDNLIDIKQMEFFDEKKLEEMQFIEKTKYIYNGGRNDRK